MGTTIEIWACSECGCTDLQHEASAEWNIEKQQWDFTLNDGGQEYCYCCSEGTYAECTIYDKETYHEADNADLDVGDLVKLRDTWKSNATKHNYTDLEDFTGLISGKDAPKYADEARYPWTIRMFNGATITAQPRDIELIAKGEPDNEQK